MFLEAYISYSEVNMFNKRWPGSRINSNKFDHIIVEFHIETGDITSIMFYDEMNEELDLLDEMDGPELCALIDDAWSDHIIPQIKELSIEGLRV